MQEQNPGILYLIPTPLGLKARFDLPEITRRVAHLRYFLAEEVRSARRFITSLRAGHSIDQIWIQTLHKGTTREQMLVLLKEVPPEADLGYLSDAGCPGIADPGALLAAHYHALGRTVVPLIGPSSLVLALMASGLQGQHWVFHGYLPIDATARARAIQATDAAARSQRQTQLCIETPYRNEALLNALCSHLHPDTLLCVAQGITTPEEQIRTLPAAQWKGKNWLLHKVPAVFLWGAA